MLFFVIFRNAFSFQQHSDEINHHPGEELTAMKNWLNTNLFSEMIISTFIYTSQFTDKSLDQSCFFRPPISPTTASEALRIWLHHACPQMATLIDNPPPSLARYRLRLLPENFEPDK